MFLHVLFHLSLVLISVAQTATIVDPQGNSVVVVTTTNAAGVPVTQTISTINPAGQVPATAVTTSPAGAPPATSATTSSTTSQPPAPPPAQGPVGQPGPTPDSPGGPTPYTYTTVINGVTTAIADNFTPSFPGTTPFTPTVTGTVWDYSQYLSSFGGAQATGSGRNVGCRNHASRGVVIIAMGCLFTNLML